MKYKLDIFTYLKIKNYLSNNKLFYFCFFNSKKQKFNLKILQQLSAQNLKITKFKSIYLKHVLKDSIFNTLIHLCSNHLVLCNISLNNTKMLLKNLSIITIFSILFENYIYNIKQFENLKSLKLISNIITFYFFLFKYYIYIFKLFNKK